MSTISIPNFTHKESEAIAEKLLGEYGFIEKGILPIDIELLANKRKCYVSVIPGVYRNRGVKGIAWKNTSNGRFEILIDEDHYTNDDKSYRFTIAEELAHSILHSSFFENISTIEQRILFEKNLDEEDHRRFEMQAKRFANHLLLPTSLFLPKIEEWMKQNSKIIDKFYYKSSGLLILEVANKTELLFDSSVFIIKRALSRFMEKDFTIGDYLLKKYKP